MRSPNRADATWRRRIGLGAIAAVGALLVGGAAVAGAELGAPSEDPIDGSVTPEQAPPRMGAEEVPDAVFSPSQAGDGSTASFAGFLDTVRSMYAGHPAPRPTDIAGLRARTAVAASGVVESAALVPVTVELGQLQAARIDLVIELSDLSFVDAPDDVDPTRFVRTVWTGDPVMVAGLMDRLTEELGPGPVGADAVIFGNIVDTPDGPVLGVFDGLVDDGSSVARLSIVLATPSGDLTTVASVVQQMGG
jgi:hypothetical protein